MPDVFSSRKRSQIMSRVKGRGNLLTEMKLIEVFRAHGFVGWRRNSRLFGKPDFVFRRSGVAIFVDGCFWHGCPLHAQWPKSNALFWRKKLKRNKRRDRVVTRTLKRLGWKTMRVWQHELRRPEILVRRLVRALGQPNGARSALRKVASTSC
jgi:DNA mismatch endonuclease, patch repair protein